MHYIIEIIMGISYGESKKWCKYEKCFAYFPVRTMPNNKIIWLRSYYKKFEVYTYLNHADVEYFHYNILECDVIIEKLTEDS